MVDEIFFTNTQQSFNNTVTDALHRVVVLHSGVPARSSMGSMRLQVRRLLRGVRPDHRPVQQRGQPVRSHVPHTNPGDHVSAGGAPARQVHVRPAATVSVCETGRYRRSGILTILYFDRVSHININENIDMLEI